VVNVIFSKDMVVIVLFTTIDVSCHSRQSAEKWKMLEMMC
jgi:hypothetical protein